MKRSAARASRALAAVVLGTSFALAGAGLALAAADPDPVIPFVDCVSSAPGASPDAFTVVFGYRNTATTPVSLAAGAAQNSFSLGPDRGQPGTFDPGVHHDAFVTTFAGASGDLTWTLGTTTVGPDAATPSCDTTTTVAVSAPAQAKAGASFDVVATVGRMLGAAPTTGSVEFSIDSSITATAPVDEQGVARATLAAPDAGAHTITARYVPAAATATTATAPATPQLLGSTATTSVTVSRASAISIASAGLSADGRSARFVVSRTASDTTGQVDYVTADGSAHAGTDFASSRGTVRFAVGQTSSTVAIPLLARPFGSPAASFYVLLQRASDTVDVAGATATLPRVTAVTAQQPGQGSALVGFAQVPQAPPPAAAAPAGGAAPTGSGAGDLALMFGGLLLTAGAAFAVVGIMRSRSSEA